MVVCLCSQITEHQLRESIRSGIHTIDGLRCQLGIGENCGCCTETAQQYIEEHCIKNF